jgi:hypothetical protein
MKRINHVSQLTLELYCHGLATNKERRQVEKALKTDIVVQKRYMAILESEKEFRKSVPQEFRPIEPQKFSTVPTSKRKKLVVGILIAAVLLCALIPAFLYLKHNNSNKDNAIAEGSDEIFIEDDSIVEDLVEVSGGEDYSYEENKKPAEKTKPENQKKPETQKGIANETNKSNTDLQQGGVQVAEAPQPDTGIHTRGGNEEQQNNTVKPPEQESNLSIPPGITFIFEKMFENKQLTSVVIPSRITSIGKNAFAGNPLVSVTIGANVNIDDEAIPGNFAKAYNSYDKAAGTYTRPNTNSEAWVKK